MNSGWYFVAALAVMAGVTYLVRLLPLLLIKRKITNRFIRSFLYYVPYTVLAVMSFPAVFYSTGHLLSGVGAVAVCILLAYMRKGLVIVAAGSAATVLVFELLIAYL